MLPDHGIWALSVVRNRTPVPPSIGDGGCQAFTIGDTNMQDRSRIMDVAVLFLFFVMATFVTFSGVLGPSPLSWLR
jgi:hypothetical protein